MKFGFEGRQHQMNYIQTNAPNGIFNFDHGGTSQCPNDFSTCGGDGMATFMMGYSDGGGYYEIQDRPATEDHQFAWFVQENWKANHKLTINVGLRYEVSVPRTDRFNRQNWLDLSAPFPVSVPGLTLTGGEVFASSHQRKIVNDDWKDIQPRFGFAYLLDPKTVIRGGYGIYYSQPRSGATGVAPYGSQGFNQYTGMITTYQNDGATPYLHLNNPYPNGLIQPAGKYARLAERLWLCRQRTAAQCHQHALRTELELRPRDAAAREDSDQHDVCRKERHPSLLLRRQLHQPPRAGRWRVTTRTRSITSPPW